MDVINLEWLIILISQFDKTDDIRISLGISWNSLMKSANVSRIFGISETGAYGVPSKSQNLIILGQGGSSST